MKFKKERLCLPAAAILAALAWATSAAAAGPPEIEPIDTNVVNTPDVIVANSPDVKVTNSSANPVPVTVENGVTVNQFQPPVPAQVTYLSGELGCSISIGCPNIIIEGENQKTWAGGHLISSISIGSENDDMTVKLYDLSDNKIAHYGAENEGWRGPLNHLTFPDPILVSRLKVECHNEAEDCEFEITVVGRSLQQ